MRSAFLVCALLVLPLLPAGAGAASGDAGTDHDAGGDVESALPVALGTFEGHVSYPGDDSDVYRFDLPDRSGVRLVVTPLSGTLFLYTLHDAGHIQSGAGASDGPIEIRSVAYGGTVHLAVHAMTEDVAYRVEATTMPRFDMSVRSVEVAPLDPAGLQREVRVEVVNDGASHNDPFDTSVRVRAFHADGSVRYVSWEGWWQMAPGETRVFAHRWDTYGELGDVRLVVEVASLRDEVPENNALALDTSVLVEGDGMDLLNQRRDAEAGPAHATVQWFSTPGSPLLWGWAGAGTPEAQCQTDSVGFRCRFPVADELLR